MSEKIVIHILNANIKTVKNAIERSLNKSINTKTLVNGVKKIHKSLSAMLGETSEETTTDELLKALRGLGEPPKGFPKNIKDFVIIDNDGISSVYSTLFTIDNISKVTERLFGETKFNLVFIASIDNELFVASFYEKGYLNGQLVVGQLNDLWSKTDNLCLNYFEKSFKIKKGTFDKLVSKGDAQFAKIQFAELTNLSCDGQPCQLCDDSIDSDKH